MGRKECKVSLRKITPKDVPQETIDTFVDQVADIKESVDGTKFREITKEFLEENRLLLAKQRRERAMNLLKTKDRAAFYSQFVGKKSGKKLAKSMKDALLSKMGGGNRLAKGVNASVDRKMVTLKIKYANRAYYGMKDKGVWEIFRDGHLEKEIMQELYELKEGGNSGISKSSEALEIAKVLRAVQQDVVGDLRRSGLVIGEIPGYIMRQSHDRLKLLESGVDEWIKTIEPHLDLEKTFGPDAFNKKARREFLEAAFKNITEGKFDTADSIIQASDELITTANYAKLGKKVAQSRKLHFKSGEAFFNYNSYFGKKDLRSSLLDSMESNSRAAALIDVFGTNPDAAFEADKIRIQKILKGDPEALDEWNSSGIQTALDNLFKEVKGFTRQGGNNLLGKTSASIRALNNMSKLGAASVRSITDLSTGASIYSSATGKDILSAHGRILDEAVKQLDPKMREDFSRKLGVYLNDYLGDIYQKFNAEADPDLPGQIAKGSQVFFKWSGLNFVTQTARNATAKLFSMELAENAAKGFDDLPEILRVNLERFDISAKQWDVIRKGVDKFADGTKGIVPEKIEGLEIENKVLRGTSAANLRNYLTDHAELGSPQPGARARARLIRGTQPGDITGEVLRFAAQFKSFPIFMYDVASRITMSNPNKPIESIGEIIKGRGDIQNLVGMIAGTTALAYMAEAALSISKNQTPPDPTKADTWTTAFVKGGAGGLYADFLLGESSRYSGSFVDNLAGPTFGLGNDVMDIFNGFRRGDDQSMKIFNTLVRNVPGQNVFYLKTSLDYLILDTIREELDPEFPAKKQRRLREQEKREIF